MHAKVAKGSRDDLYPRLLRTDLLWLLLVLAAVALAIAVGLGQQPSDASEALGLIWQVHASFVSIGFAGLTIAFQILSDPPLVVGSARQSVIQHVRFYPMLLLGVGSNLLIGAAVILTDSWIVVWAAAAILLVPTLVAIGWAFRRLAKLYGSPIQIEELTLRALEQAVDEAGDHIASKRAEEATFRAQLDPARGLYTRSHLPTVDSREDRKIQYLGRPGTVTIRIGPLAHAIDLLSYEAIRNSPGGTGTVGLDDRPGVYVSVRPGARVDVGTVIAQIRYPAHVSDAYLDTAERLVRAAVEITPNDPASPSEALLSETSSLQDGVLQAIEGGLAERARRGRRYYERILGYLPFSGHEPVFVEETRRRLERQVWEIDYAAAQRSRRFAMDADSAALRRATAAIRTSDPRALRSALLTFATVWDGLLASQIPGAGIAREHLLVSLQNLTEFVIPNTHSPDQFKLKAAEEAVWTFVMLAKASIDADDPSSLSRVLGYHNGLYRFTKARMASVEPEIYAGSIALLAWILYSAELSDTPTQIDPSVIRPEQRQGVDLYQIVARLDRETGSGRWREWEQSDHFPLRTYRLKIDDYAARATLFLLSRGSIPIPPMPSTVEQANALSWLIQQAEGAMAAWHSTQVARELAGVIDLLRERLDSWDQLATQQLWFVDIDPDRLDQFDRAVQETLTSKHTLGHLLKPVPTGAQSASVPIGLELSNVPKEYFVDVPGVLAFPTDLGEALARSLVDHHDQAVLDLLREHGRRHRCTLEELRQVTEETISSMSAPLLIVAGYSQILEALGIPGDADAATLGSRSLVVCTMYGVLDDGQAFLIDLDRSLNVDFTPRSEDRDRPLAVRAVPPSTDPAEPAVVAVTGVLDMTWSVQLEPMITLLQVIDAEW